MIEAGRMPGIGKSLQFTLVEIERGRAVFEGTPGLHAYNPIAWCMEVTRPRCSIRSCGCAVHASLAPGQKYTTLELKVAYHKAMTAETGVVRAVGTVLSIRATRGVCRGEADRCQRHPACVGDLDAAGHDAISDLTLRRRPGLSAEVTVRLSGR